jgi:G3E family GTPase
MNSIQPKPVTIITGFLGAGKTTFLNALLTQNAKGKYAIIENEFGKESIDGELVVEVADSVFEMSSGCLCCSLNEDLVELLISLSGKAVNFEELIIETTGIADPASVGVPFLVDPLVTRYYELQRVVCVVDAQNIVYELASTEEARKQISFSDILLISKTDLITAEELEDTKNLLYKINPFATVLAITDGTYPIDEIMNFERNVEQVTVNEDTSVSKHKEHHHHSLSSLTLLFDDPFDLPKLHHTLMIFLAAQAKDIYRVKGIVYAQDEDRKVIVQSVAQYLSLSHGKHWEDDEIKRSRIVFIGKNLKSKGFERLLRQCLYKAEPDKIYK